MTTMSTFHPVDSFRDAGPDLGRSTQSGGRHRAAPTKSESHPRNVFEPSNRSRSDRKQKCRGTKRAPRLFIVISCVIALTDMLFVYINYLSGHATLLENIHEEGRDLAHGLGVLIANEEARLLEIAGEISENEEIRQLTLQADQLLASGGTVDELDRINRRLFIAASRFSHPEIHIHARTECRSLLRFHEPSEWGESLCQDRPMVAATTTTNLSNVGFEIGATRLGIRAIVPIRAFDPESQTFVHVGSVETMTPLYTIISRFSDDIGGHAIVLLDAPHLREHLTDRSMNMRYLQGEFIDDLVFETASDYSLLQEFNDSTLINSMLEDGTHLVEHDGNVLSVTPVRLSEFHQHNDHELHQHEDHTAEIGSIILWRDADAAFEGFYRSQATNIAFAFGAFTMIELLLFAGLRVATYQLRQIVDKQTHDLQQANAQLKAQSESLAKSASELEVSRQEAETARRAAELANRAKSRFLASMSHELRTPLNAILGFSSIIRDKMFGHDEPEKYSEYAEDINRSGQHLLEIINDILDIAKIEAGQFKMNPELVSLYRLSREAMRLVAVRAEEKAIDLVIDPSSDKVDVVIDRKAIKRVLLNLLSNAVKFTPNGGRVSICVTLTDDKTVRLSVSDTGIGIPADRIAKVLEPFEQVDNDYTRRENGTGLGLSLVKSLVDLHKGVLTIDSEEGKGTTVGVALPAGPDYKTVSSPERSLANAA